MSLVTEIEKSLFEVIDPELGVNIMDLGLIYGVEVGTDNDVKINMTLTTPGCPMHDSITMGVKHQLEQLDAIGEIDVNLIWEPAWTPDKMSDSAKEMLGM
ncbi:metal-sulfur cluster assembly factor [Virgibacillus sp. DJP39]|uniref:metal-sulfur cluster assembly factor n=1 Tax=Virgibacillus sp. DJP39 TaxID=3409790 RepID=UPI003BB57D0A